MVKRLLFLNQSGLHTYLSIFVLFLSVEMNGQCNAGSDNSIAVCDIADVSSKTVDLNVLLGTHDAAGTWKDDNSSGGLDTANGILNAQKIQRGDIYHYTYTVSDGLGCTDTAVITVTIGGYTGTPSAGSICSNSVIYNLFTAFKGVPTLPPQIGGVWSDDDGSGALNLDGYTIDASLPIPDDTYSYTYTIGAIGVCPAPPPAQISVSIYRLPVPGEPSDFVTCSDQLALYTNLNLNTLLTAADSGGNWYEQSGTVTITGGSFIDLQNIYTTTGSGNYEFVHMIKSDNQYCPNQSSSVHIIIEDPIDLTDATLTIDSNICESEIGTATYSGTITSGPAVIANGIYRITYTVNTALPVQITATCLNGELKFSIPSINFQVVGDYTITITDFELEQTQGICTNIITPLSAVLSIYPTPTIGDDVFSVGSACKDSDLSVAFFDSSLADGSYEIFYNLSRNNIATASAIMNVVGGAATFTIPGNLLPNLGSTRIRITGITNTNTGCSYTVSFVDSFTVNQLPDVSGMAVTAGNQCLGKSVNVHFTGLGSLTSIKVTYEISGANTVNAQTVSLNVTSGNADLSIPANYFLNAGNNTFHLTDLINEGNNCSAILNSVSANFIITTSLSNPIANDQKFCGAEFATIADLDPKGNQYKWLSSPGSPTPLASNVLLTTATYYVKEVDGISGCESGLTVVNVTVNEVPAPVAVDQGFCKTDLATILDLNPNGSQYRWVDSPGSTIPLGSGVLLTTATYYVKGVDSVSGCESVPTTVSVIVKEMLPVAEDQKFCKTDLATIANLVPEGNQYKWFDSPTNTIPLNSTIPLITATYYVKEVDALLGCESALIPLDVTVTEVETPIADGQKFCKTDLATIADLVPNGDPYKWFDSSADNPALSSNDLLATATYYLKRVDALSGCKSIATPVGVVINEVPTPILNSDGQKFCGVDKPTIGDLSHNTVSGENLVWYDAVVNGTQLSQTDLLKEGATYYGLDYSDATGCYSTTALEVTVSLTDCIATSENFVIPDGFSPNGDGVNDTFQIKDIEFLYPNYTLEIYNRYGNVLFKGNINKPGWDGKSSGSNILGDNTPSGVYFYIINYNKDNLSPKQGYFYLNR